MDTFHKTIVGAVRLIQEDFRLDYIIILDYTTIYRVGLVDNKPSTD